MPPRTALGSRKPWLLRAPRLAGSYFQLFAKISISGFFFVVLVKNTPFNSERLDLLVEQNQWEEALSLLDEMSKEVERSLHKIREELRGVDAENAGQLRIF